MWITIAASAAVVAWLKGTGWDSALHFVIGLIVGALAIAFAFTSGEKCYRCKKVIHKQAKVCAYCNHEFAQ